MAAVQLIRKGNELFLMLQHICKRVRFYFLKLVVSGCSIHLGEGSDTVVSPGYLIEGANYPANQTCIYDVTVPGLETVTLVFSAIDIHPSDEIKVRPRP